jgi:hypothetical protein
MYQFPDGKWSEVTTELKSLGSSDEVLTHAVISSTTGAQELRDERQAC